MFSLLFLTSIIAQLFFFAVFAGLFVFNLFLVQFNSIVELGVIDNHVFSLGFISLVVHVFLSCLFMVGLLFLVISICFIF